VTSVEGDLTTRTGIGMSPGGDYGLSQTYEQLSMPEWVDPGQIVIPSYEAPDSVVLWLFSISPKTFRVIGSPRRLTQGNINQVGLSVAAGYLAYSFVTERANIWALPVDHAKGKPLGEIQALTEDSSINGLPCISSDDTKLVYTSVRSGAYKGLVKDLKTGSIKPILTELMKTFIGIPKVSRDGAKVAYCEYSQNKPQLFVADTDDLTSKFLCEYCGQPADWFPDGHKLLLYGVPFVSGRRLDSIDVNSGSRSSVFQYPRGLILPHVSPDGRWVAGHGIDAGITPKISIMVVPLRNGVEAEEKEWVRITDGSGFEQEVDWSPDGNLLYFLSERDGSRCIWGQKLDPANKTPMGAPFPVYHSHDPRRSIRNVRLDYLSMSVSHNQIVFPMGELTGNIWIMETQGWK